MGRTATGVRGVTLQGDDDHVVGIISLPKKIGPQEPCLFYLRMATVREPLLMILKQEILSIGELIEGKGPGNVGNRKTGKLVALRCWGLNRMAVEDIDIRPQYTRR